MALSALDDGEKKPSDSALKSVLGRSTTHWHAFKKCLPSLTEQWTFSGAKYGWSLRLLHKKRVIVYMIPCRKHFLAGFVLGEKAMQAVRASDLPPTILDAMNAAPKYGEGRGVRLEVRTKADVGNMAILVAIKMEN